MTDPDLKTEITQYLRDNITMLPRNAELMADEIIEIMDCHCVQVFQGKPLQAIFINCKRCNTNISILALQESKFYVATQGRTRITFRCSCGQPTALFRDDYDTKEVKDK